MIEFDYKIVREEEKETYTPTISQELGDLICIHGPNSSGKSTLLNIIGLSFFGLKYKRIHPSLRRKMASLLEDGLAFEIKLVNKKNNLQLISKKNDLKGREWSTYEVINGKKLPLSWESFNEKYSLIYDIPDDPTKRLEELTQTLKNKQKELGEKVTRLGILVRQTMVEVKNAKDPKQIEKLKNELEKLRKDSLNKTREKDELNNDLLFLERYFYCKSYVELKERYNNKEQEIKAFKGRIRTDKKEKKDMTVEEQRLSKESNQLVINIRSKLSEVKYLIKIMFPDEKSFISVWDRMELQKELLDTDEEKDILYRGIIHFRKKISEIGDKSEEKRRIEEANLFHAMINILKNYLNVKLIIPGVEKSIPEFLTILEKKYKEYENLKNRYDNFQQISVLLKDIEDLRRNFISEYAPKIRKIIKLNKKILDTKDESGEEKFTLQALEDELKEFGKELTYFRNECINLKINEDKIEDTLKELGKLKDLKHYFEYTHKQLNKAVTTMKKEKIDLEQEIDTLDHRMHRFEHDIELMEKQDEHKYHGYLNILDEIFDTTDILRQKIIEGFDKYLETMEDCLLSGNTVSQRFSEPQKKYFEQVSFYLAKRLGFIRHVDQEYEVKKIDLLSGKIYTNAGKIIKLTSMGTGQSQSAYLRGLLNQSDGKKMIALIDEVAMMDSKSLRPIFDILHRLYDAGELLIAIVAQFDEGKVLKVSPIP